MPRISKESKKFLKENRKKSKFVLSQDKDLRTFLNLGGRAGAKKDFFSVLKRAVKNATS